MTQSIIVYRNPLEQIFWEGIVGNEYAFPIAMAVVVYIVFMTMFNSPLEKIYKKVYWKLTKTHSWNVPGFTKFLLIVSAIPAVLVFYFFKI